MSIPASPDLGQTSLPAPRALPWALLLCGAAALAQPVPQATPAREGIDVQRRAAVAEYDAARRECATRFEATRCLEQARVGRDTKLEALRQQQFRLDDQLRLQRAAERQRSVQEKSAKAQSRTAGAPEPNPSGGAVRDAAASSPNPSPNPQPNPQPKPMLKPMPSSPPKPTPRRSDAAAAAATDSASAAAAREASKRALYQHRIDEADAHRAEVLSRNAARDARKPPAAGLPASAASSSGR